MILQRKGGEANENFSRNHDSFPGNNTGRGLTALLKEVPLLLQQL